MVVLALALILTIPAQAATRAVGAELELTFSDNIATCEAFVTAANSHDNIEAVIELWQGRNCIKTWNRSAEAVLDFTGTAAVTKGKTYTLTVDYTVNGIVYPTVSTSNTYK